jgi:cholesterol oxidase
MDRREFGRRLLEASALLGLRTLVPRASVGVLGATLAACSSREGSPDPSTPGAHSPVIIVGSGYGAAVTAMRLTQRGIPVTLIEKGRLWDKPGSDGLVFCSNIAPDERAMWFQETTAAVVKKFMGFPTSFPVPKKAGVLQVHHYPNMDVYGGCGVGGGSLVNMAMYVTPVRELLARTLPGVDMDEMYDLYYPRAKSVLGTNKISEAFFQSTPWYQYVRVGDADARSIGIEPFFLESGYDYAYMEQEANDLVPKSALNNEAGFGNNYGKKSLDKTYLAEAMSTGLLTILSLHPVKRIERASDGGFVVTCDEIDVDGNVLATKALTCKRLFVCAGSVGTTELLVRARETGALPDLNEAIGTGWGPNSDIFVGRTQKDSVMTGDKISMVPATGIRTLDHEGKPFFSMSIPFPAGFETHISFSICMTENREAGRFSYDAATDSAQLVWAASQQEPAVRAARSVFDRMNIASGSSYRSEFFDSDFGTTSTYHSLGGCPLNQATDGYGRITAYPGLYVIDGSLIPVTLGANPALTITALSERNIERILAEDFRV